ncbi:MAG TPA: type VI secretion system tip protein TssI/VgrG [Fimbriiglobus sp.]
MPPTTQAGRLIRVTTPLGADAILAVGFSGREAISAPFRFTLDARGDQEKKVSFDSLIGKPVSVGIEIASKKVRYFHGICSRISQGDSDVSFTNYQLELVPTFWILSKTVNSRIFQQKSVQDILKKVLNGVDTEYQLSGTYNPREYCVQYQESDFAFCSRLMEEEGIFYFFKHTAGGHKMVIADTPQSFPAVPDGPEKVQYKRMSSTGESLDRITQMAKAQDLASAKFTLWDHTFELPHKNQEQAKPIAQSATVGTVTHKLSTLPNLEVYDWPGDYAKRYDQVDKGGGDQDAELQKILPDGKRTVELRAEREVVSSLVVYGTSFCRHFTSGHKFTVETLSSEKETSHLGINGSYVLTEITHMARIGDNLRSGPDTESYYENTFSALPLSVPFRPDRTTPRPFVHGCQTAVVVGPSGEEIFTDKFGRVKVQFHWDREGKNDAGSSCWCRVAVGSAGRNWGMIAIPRIGQEVLVDFLEGNPDYPIIVGSVYNPDQMPPYKLPDEKTKSVWKSNTTLGGVGFNEFRFEDKKDKEQIFIHAERNMDERVKHDRMERVIHDRHLIVGLEKDGGKSGSQFEEVLENKHLKVHKDQEEQIGGNFKLLVGGDNHLHVKGKRAVKIDANDNLTVNGDMFSKITGGDATEAEKIHLKAGQSVVIEADIQISLKVGGNFISITSAGVAISGATVLINSGGSAMSATSVSPEVPTDASATKPTEADDSKTGNKSCD